LIIDNVILKDVETKRYQRKIIFICNWNRWSL